MANRIKWTPKKQAEFLAGLAQGYPVVRAAKRCNVSPSLVYERRQADPEFAAAWDEALEQGTQVLEEEARRRAVEGVTKEKGIYYRGDLIGTEIEIEYSDTLLMFLLKGRRPDVYRENVTHRHGGDPDNSAPIAITSMTAVPPAEVS